MRAEVSVLAVDGAGSGERGGRFRSGFAVLVASLPVGLSFAFARRGALPQEHAAKLQETTRRGLGQHRHKVFSVVAAERDNLVVVSNGAGQLRGELLVNHGRKELHVCCSYRGASEIHAAAAWTASVEMDRCVEAGVLSLRSSCNLFTSSSCRSTGAMAGGGQGEGRTVACEQSTAIRVRRHGSFAAPPTRLVKQHSRSSSSLPPWLPPDVCFGPCAAGNYTAL